MSGAHALRELGPSGKCRAALLVWVVAAGLAAGCAPPSAPLPAVPPGIAPEVDNERFADLEVALGGDRPDSVAAAAMRASGITPAFERRFVLDAATGVVVAGFIPGGYPVDRDSLVVAIALGSSGGAALLEAARFIAERAAYQPGPAQTIMVALSVPNGTIESDPTSALRRTLAVPVWDPSHVSGVVMVGQGAGDASEAALERDLAFIALTPVPGARTSDLTMSAYAALLEAAAVPRPAARDTSVAP